MNTPQNLQLVRTKFQGKDRTAFAELLARLEDDPEDNRSFYHLVELYKKHGAKTDVVVDVPEGGYPQCR